jgi:hypothetical protein
MKTLLDIVNVTGEPAPSLAIVFKLAEMRYWSRRAMVRGQSAPWTRPAAATAIRISCTRRMWVLKILAGASTLGKPMTLAV